MAARGRPRNFDRNDALDRALDLFWKHGYDNTSMADLSAAMELRPPSIYAAFGSKEGLFEEVVDRYVERIGSGIWGDLDRFKSAKKPLVTCWYRPSIRSAMPKTRMAA